MKDYEKLSRDHFNKQAPVYDERDNLYYSGPAKISCHDAAVYLSSHDFASLLDVGCGTGYFLALLAQSKPAAYYGLDIAQEMIKAALDKNIPGAEFKLGTADNLPYSDNTFDIVTCIQSFHHYPYPDKAMQEALRVLKPGGLYLLADTGIGGLGAWIDNHLIFPFMNSGDYRTDNKEGIGRRMEKNGFRVIERKRVKRFIYRVVAEKPGNYLEIDAEP